MFFRSFQIIQDFTQERSLNLVFQFLIGILRLKFLIIGLQLTINIIVVGTSIISDLFLYSKKVLKMTIVTFLMRKQHSPYHYEQQKIFCFQYPNPS